MAAAPAEKNWGTEEMTSAKFNAMQPMIGLDAEKAASPTAGMSYYATDTLIMYVCFAAGTWSECLPAVLLDGDENIDGIKTFFHIPVLPASDPTTDNQAARKLYVDAKMNIVKCGSVTHSAADTGAQNIAHGLGRVPKLVKITAIYNQGGTASHVERSDGTYNGTTTVCIYQHIYIASSAQSSVGVTASYMVNLPDPTDGDKNCQATIAVDATNITLTWTKDSTPTGTVSLMWEAIG